MQLTTNTYINYKSTWVFRISYIKNVVQDFRNSS